MARVLDIIEYPDVSADELVRRVPAQGSGDFRIGSQLIVREGQAAVFFRDGKALDTFGPGRHTITTANIPLLVNLIGLAFSGNTPFTAECYFVNVRDMLDQRWGTSEPITLRDEVLRMVRVRAHGVYSMAVSEPQRFVAQVVGARGFYSTRDITNYLRGMIVSRLTDLLGENMRSLLDLPARFEEISVAARVRLREEFESLGLVLKQFYIMSVSPTEDTSAAIDEAASMGAIGDMDRYLKFKAARAVGDAAVAGGEAGAGTQMGLGLGTGLAMGKVVADSLTGRTEPQPATPTPAQPAAPATPAADMVKCPNCGHDNAQAAKFCNNCGNRLATTVACSNCGHENPAAAKFCQNCGNKLS